jgi:hypothetical protein
MPTGEDQRNPRGLMEAAGQSRKQTAEVHAQVDRFLAELGEQSELASAFDEAVMREDRDAVVELVRKGGVEGEITIEGIEADRRISITVCVWVFCVTHSIEW